MDTSHGTLAVNCPGRRPLAARANMATPALEFKSHFPSREIVTTLHQSWLLFTNTASSML
jgi:hypothetical protein